MSFTFNATITDTSDAIQGIINQAVASATSPINARITAVKQEIDGLETRISALENDTTPTPPVVADATIVGHTAASILAATTSKTVAKPSGVQAGDLLVMIVAADWGLGSAVNPTTGFTQLKEHDLGTNYLKVNVSYKVAGSSEPASYSVGVSTESDSRVDLIAIRNAKTSGPFPIASVGVIDNTNLTSANTQQVVPATDRGLLILSAAVSKSQVGQYDYSFTPPTGMTELTDANTNRWLALSTAYGQYNSATEVPSRGFKLSTTATKVDKVLISLVIPSAGS